MKKHTLLTILIALSVFSLSAEAKFNYDDPFGWQSPEIMAQGGSFTAVASGFGSLMTNPAGFAMSKTYKYIESEDENGERVVEKKEKGEVTVLGILPYAMVNPFILMNDLAASSEISMQTITDAVLNQSSTNGIGAGMQFGFGYVGHGFGFGIISTLDMMFPQADNIIALNGDVTLTTAFVGGYAHKFDLGPFGLSVGADVRPMWRIKARDINIDAVMSIAGIGGTGEVDLASIDILTGFAIGFDAGAILEWKLLSFGLSLRDIGHTRYMYQQTNGVDIQSDPFSGTELADLEYVTPMTMRIGLGIHPDLGNLRKIIDPKVHVEYVIPMIDAANVASYEESSFWVNLHAGAEVKLLSFLSVRAGYSSGYLSAGIGLDLFIAELNAALYSQETGSNSGSNQQMGASVELAFRY